nr:DUF1983 domain-containing protein [Enterobacter hormaechei]
MVRRFRTADVEVARKNAKSTLCSGVGLYMAGADGEGGAEVYSAATTRDQARIVFEDAKNMVKKAKATLGRIFEFNKLAIYQEQTASKFEPLSSDANNLDGLNIHCAITDTTSSMASRLEELRARTDTASGGIQNNAIALITSTLAQVDQQVRLSAQYGDSKAGIDRIDNVMASDREATARSLLSLQTDVNGNKASINSLNQTFSDYQQATATQINGITATINGHTSAITTNAQAIANVNGDLKAMYSIKVGLSSNGQYYAAGMGIGVENTPSGMQSQVIFLADRFAVTHQAGATVTLPFVIQNGQTIIRDTVIGDGTIGNAKIGSYIQSSTWDGTGNVGWHINKSGYATFNNVTVRGSIYATNGNFSFNGSGNTTVINGNGVTINIPGGGRIVLGTWT